MLAIFTKLCEYEFVTIRELNLNGRFADLNVHKTNMYGELNGLVNIAALTLFIFRYGTVHLSQIQTN